MLDELGDERKPWEMDNPWEFWDKMCKKKLKNHKEIPGVCPHCNRCPVCGRVLWPTPHGFEDCHLRPGIYTDGVGLFIAID